LFRALVETARERGQSKDDLLADREAFLQDVRTKLETQEPDVDWLEILTQLAQLLAAVLTIVLLFV
jgi:hypothetical protein